MPYRFNLSLLLACLVFTSCVKNEPNTWQNLDYTSVYRAAKQRELDRYYEQPSIVGCMDEDLYNCQ